MKRFPLYFLFVCLCLSSLSAAADSGQEGGGAPVSPPGGNVPEESVIEKAEEIIAGDAVLPAGTLSFSEKLGIAAAIVLGQAVLIALVWFAFRKLAGKIRADAGGKIKPFAIKKFPLLTSKQIVDIIVFLLKIAKYLITVFQLFITVPIIFSLYPSTQKLAVSIFDHTLNPLKKILLAAVKYIPNVITIVIFLLITRYILRALKFFAVQITKGKLTLPGFYREWAWPTYNILRVFLYAFTVAMIYPYLPGSESRAFQGVSVFVGIIVSLGSSSAIGNLVAGLVITYMRPFKIGDRIKIKDLTGFVVEKSPFVVRVRNIKNEYITFPNLTVLNSEIVNYKTSGEEQGLVLHAKVTMGYDVPWRDVHGVLLRAAAKTSRVEKEPEPFVLQTAMDDFYMNYEINIYTKEMELFPAIYSELFQNIQDEFTAAGISMYCPHRYAQS